MTLRVVLIGPVYPYRGGISHHTTLLAQHLRAVTECRVVSFKRQYPKRIYPGRTDIDPSQEIIEAEAEYLLDPLNPLTWIQTARDLVRWNPDRVVIPWWVTVWGPLVATVAYICRRNGIPITFMVHNVTPHDAGFWDPVVSKFALHCGDRFVVHSENQRLRLREMLPRAEVVLIPHPPYPMFTPNKKPKKAAKSALGIDPNMPTVLFFGMVRPYKGLSHVIQAVSLLKEAGCGVCLIIAGEFWSDKSEYLESIGELNLEDDIIIDDRYVPNEQVALYFSAADMVTVPYLGGTQSGVAAIATSFGLPIIVTEHIRSGIYQDHPEMIHVVPPASPRAIEEAARRIIEASPGNPSPTMDPNPPWDDLVAALLGQDEPNQPAS